MLPIKIATIRLLQIMKALNTLNTLFCLFPVYIAMGLPTAVFILTEFIHGLPRELYEAGYMDGASRFRIFWSFRIIRILRIFRILYVLIVLVDDLRGYLQQFLVADLQGQEGALVELVVVLEAVAGADEA